jgi:RNA polymerase sigma-70 factor (ECF subfamily)
MTIQEIACARINMKEEQLTAPEESCESLESIALVLRARDGDPVAFERLMVRHQRQVLCIATRMLRRHEDAQDVAQEVFLKLYRYLPRIRPETVKAWFYQVTVHACWDVVRKSKKLQTTALDEDDAGKELALAWDQNVEANLNLAERRRLLQNALLSLPFKERAALVLRDIEGLSTEETARILGSSETTIRSQISCARVKIRRHCERALGRGR